MTLSRAQWAAHIRKAHTETFAAVLELGRTLLAARKALPRGQFLEMIKHDLPFKPSTAQRLMKIARDPKITNAAHCAALPSAWGTLYELTKLPEKAFKEGLAAGDVHRGMTRKDAAKIVHLKVTREPRRIVAPYYVRTEQGRPTPTLVPATAEITPLSLLEKLDRLEKQASDLWLDVQQHGVDAAVERRIRDVVEKLLSLFEDRPAVAMLQ